MKPERTPRQRLIFVLRASLVVLVLAAVFVPTALGVGFMRVVIASSCGGETTPPMPYEAVSFPSGEFKRPTPAYFIPAGQPTGATVIVVPTGNAGRGDRMAEIAVYHQGGFNVLTYNSRVCVGNVPSSLGYKEAAQVGDALAYLATRSDVDQQRIGIHGFSGAARRRSWRRRSFRRCGRWWPKAVITISAQKWTATRRRACGSRHFSASARGRLTAPSPART